MHSTENDAVDLRAILHGVWLRVHNRRFDEARPDSFYNGIREAESVIHEVAAEHGIDWHALREVPGTVERCLEHGIPGCLRSHPESHVTPPVEGKADA